MPIAQIIDLPGAGVRDYEAAFALIHPDGVSAGAHGDGSGRLRHSRRTRATG